MGLCSVTQGLGPGLRSLTRGAVGLAVVPRLSGDGGGSVDQVAPLPLGVVVGVCAAAVHDARLVVVNSLPRIG